MTEKKQDYNHSSVCLDGSEVKRIRESQGLTQLYVSKVVGVTTDTISRWENNRYPTIRRDNALKLAEALEVSLDTLLRKIDEPYETASDPKKKLPQLLLGIAVVLVIVFAVTFTIVSEAPPPPASVTAERVLPKYAAPETAIPVILNLARHNEDGFILREYFPKGWKLIQSFPPSSSLDNISGMVRWIIKAGDRLDRIVYLVKVNIPEKPDSQETFQGEVIVGSDRVQSSVPILGDTLIEIANIHWADSDGDGSINDVEMLQASYTIEDMSGVHMDWDSLERLWDAGGYRWDQKKNHFVPVRHADQAQAN